MILRGETAPVLRAVTLELELAHGRYGASARIEIEDRAARLALHGWIDREAAQRLDWTLDQLAGRGLSRVELDCSHLRHIDFRVLPELVASLDRFESRAGGVVVSGLSHYLRDLFRLAGCESRLRGWPSAAELVAPALERERECAS